MFHFISFLKKILNLQLVCIFISPEPWAILQCHSIVSVVNGSVRQHASFVPGAANGELQQLKWYHKIFLIYSNKRSDFIFSSVYLKIKFFYTYWSLIKLAHLHLDSITSSIENKANDKMQIYTTFIFKGFKITKSSNITDPLISDYNRI